MWLLNCLLWWECRILQAERDASQRGKSRFESCCFVSDVGWSCGAFGGGVWLDWTSSTVFFYTLGHLDPSFPQRYGVQGWLNSSVFGCPPTHLLSMHAQACAIFMQICRFTDLHGARQLSNASHQCMPTSMPTNGQSDCLLFIPPSLPFLRRHHRCAELDGCSLPPP